MEDDGIDMQDDLKMTVSIWKMTVSISRIYGISCHSAHGHTGRRANGHQCTMGTRPGHNRPYLHGAQRVHEVALVPLKGGEVGSGEEAVGRARCDMHVHFKHRAHTCPALTMQIDWGGQTGMARGAVWSRSLSQ